MGSIFEMGAGASASSGSDRTVMLLFGPPGSGKGSQAPRISNGLGVPHLSTGDMLRAVVAAGTDVGVKADALMKAGELVPDEVVFGVVKDRIKEEDCKKGFILDGLPRTSGQVTLLDSTLAETSEKVNCVIALEIADELLTERITGRWIHKASGRSYHVKTNPPKSLGENAPSAETMLDDETGEALEQRKDDTEDALKKRLEGYHAQSKPVLEHYDPLGVVHRINANASPDDVWKAIEALYKPAGAPEESTS